MEDIRPIETRYAGHRFRSRLEARWAVLLSELGIRWQYEPQGFTIGRRRYLPDFWLPDLGIWGEVKGSDGGIDKGFMQTAAGLLPGGILILGPIPAPDPNDEDWAWLYLRPGSEPGSPPEHHRVSLAMSARKMRPWLTFGPGPVNWTLPALSGEMMPEVSTAYTAALCARFEWGETPCVR